MEKLEFSKCRKSLAKTQKELSVLLGVSLKAIHSYEQGWRKIPSHIERQLYFLLTNRRGNKVNLEMCWDRKKCAKKSECPAWEFQAGHLCWFMCGTLCDCSVEIDCKEKMDICRQCEVLTRLLKN